jgi:hypothetical protein
VTPPEEGRPATRRPVTVADIARTGEVFGFGRRPVAVSLYGGGPLWVFAETDAGEHEHRSATGVKALADRRLLGVLADLPYGQAVEWARLDRRTRALLQCRSDVVRRTDQTVTRTVRRPVRISGAVASGRWANVAERLGSLRTVCPIAVLTSQRPRTAGIANVEAAVLGYGLAWIAPGGEIRVAQHPDSSQRLHRGFEWWVFELTYEAILRADAAIAGGRDGDARRLGAAVAKGPRRLNMPNASTDNAERGLS